MLFCTADCIWREKWRTFSKNRRTKQAAAVAEAIPKNKLISAGEGKTFDPHVWFSIPLWIYAVDEIEAQFSKAMPEHADDFKKNAKEYKEDLQYLDKWSRQEIENIPEKSRVLVTAHDAFAYFGKEYGFQVKGLQGLSTDSDYGLKDVQELVDLLTEKQIKAVFVESAYLKNQSMQWQKGLKKRPYSHNRRSALFGCHG